MTTTILYFVVRFYEKKVNDNKNKYLITMIRKILKSRKVIVINY